MIQIEKHLDHENKDLSPNFRLLETRCQVISRKQGGPLGLSFTFMKSSKVDLNKYSELTFYKSTNTIQWRKNILFT